MTSKDFLKSCLSHSSPYNKALIELLNKEPFQEVVLAIMDDYAEHCIKNNKAVEEIFRNSSLHNEIKFKEYMNSLK